MYLSWERWCVCQSRGEVCRGGEGRCTGVERGGVQGWRGEEEDKQGGINQQGKEGNFGMKQTRISIKVLFYLY